MPTIYDFKLKKRDGSILNLADYKGKVMLIVNTATGCGFTPQYEGLENLYKKYHEQGLEIIDLPCNQFGHQAPGSDAEIHEFCTAKYQTTFDQLAKIEVNGEHEDPLYTYLKAEAPFAGFSLAEKVLVPIVKSMDKDYKNNNNIKWNFTKFLIDKDGKVVKRYESMTKPEKIDQDIAELLKA